MARSSEEAAISLKLLVCIQETWPYRSPVLVKAEVGIVVVQCATLSIVL